MFSVQNWSRLHNCKAGLVSTNRCLTESQHPSVAAQSACFPKFPYTTKLTSLSPQTASEQHRDLFVDGYIAFMFGPRDAAVYQVSLLKKRESIEIHWHVDATGTFWAQPPPGLTPDQQYWVIDLAARETGPVIRQKIWAPKKISDKLRRVDHEQLYPPIFFIHKNGQDLGLPLTGAARGNCMCLRGAEVAAPVRSSSHVHIRINVSLIFDVHSPDLTVTIYYSQWRGYQHLEWNEQITIQKQTQEKETISLETFAKHVARKVLKFMEVISILLHKPSPGN